MKLTPLLVNRLAKQAGINMSKYGMKQMMMGIKVEREHDQDGTAKDVVKRPSDLVKIAASHLDEIPDYYSRLQKMEASAKNESINNRVTRIIKEVIDETIHKAGSKWKITTKNGKRTLGTHSSKKKAQAQLAAIEINKHR